MASDDELKLSGIGALQIIKRLGVQNFCLLCGISILLTLLKVKDVVFQSLVMEAYKSSIGGMHLCYGILVVVGAAIGQSYCSPVHHI